MTKQPAFRKKRSYTFPAVIIALVLAASFIVPNQLGPIRAVAASAFYPLQWAGSAIWRGTVTFPSTLANLGNLARENSELKEKLNITMPQIAQMAELRLENDRLRDLLGFSNRNRYSPKFLPAQVIGRGADPWQSLLEIDRGSGSGVRVNMPVIVRAGLAGKVVEVSPASARVMLLTDPRSLVAAADQRSRDFGVAEGIAPDRLKLKFVNSSGDVKEGDLIVTSNSSSFCPPGITVGTVARASKKETDLFYEIEVKPAADLSKLEEVLLVF